MHGLTITVQYTALQSVQLQGKWPVRTGIDRTDTACCRRTPSLTVQGQHPSTLSKRSQYGLKRYANGLKWYANGARTASVYSRLSPSYARVYGPFPCEYTILHCVQCTHCSSPDITPSAPLMYGFTMVRVYIYKYFIRYYFVQF